MTQVVGFGDRYKKPARRKATTKVGKGLTDREVRRLILAIGVDRTTQALKIITTARVIASTN